MRSGMIFKNPDKPVNHKPMIAAGAVVAYNLLKSRGSEASLENTTRLSSPEGYSIGGICLMLCLISPFLWILFASISPTAATIATYSVLFLYAVTILRFIYVLCSKD